MGIKRIEITDFGPIEEMVVEPRAVTIVSGENKTGKTMFLNAIKAVFAGGHDPDWIRNGAKKALVRLELDDGRYLLMTVTKRTTNREVFCPDGTLFNGGKEPMTIIKSLTDTVGFDPVSFLAMKPKEQMQAVLEAMPIEFTAEELAKIFEKWKLEGTPAETLDLAEFKALRKTIFDERTGINRTRTELEKTVDALMRSLPPETEDCQANLEVAERELRGAETAKRREEEQANHARDAELLRIQNDYEIELEKLQQKREQQQIAATKTRDEEFRKIAERYRDTIGDAGAKVATLKEQSAASLKAAGAREQLARFREDLSEKTKRHDALTYALEDLDALRESKLKDLPIEGLAPDDDGNLTYEGFRFDKVNTAGQYLVAAQLAALRAGDLGFMILDRAESFDEANLTMLIDAFRKSGLQIAMSRVEKRGERTVQTLD